ncbi:hypothetical protein ACHAWO_012721 [Cyclotella atomus]|uniref:Cyclic nucleotide-binding domain-containing protein n=1 Tax=Cyclotella atomus TaxID=382360 RepID=A0ABD3Q1K8_9STRA
MSSGDSNSPNRYDNLILDSSSQRLLELTSRSPHERSSEAIDELLSILQRKVPKLLDGLADSNKVQIGKQCKLKMYRKNDVVFLQGDEPDAYYTVIRGAVSIYFTKPDSTEPCSSVADCEDLASAEYTTDNCRQGSPLENYLSMKTASTHNATPVLFLMAHMAKLASRGTQPYLTQIWSSLKLKHRTCVYYS